jgi:hypothetical protein
VPLVCRSLLRLEPLLRVKLLILETGFDVDEGRISQRVEAKRGYLYLRMLDE